MRYLIALVAMAGLAATLAIWLPESRSYIVVWLITLAVNSMERQHTWDAAQSLY